MGSRFSIGNIFQKAFSGRWIAGAYMEDAVMRTRQLNALKMCTIINYLGEEFREESDVSNAVSTYIQLVKTIKSKKLDAIISLKVTQLGLLIDKKLARKNYASIVDFARKHGVFVFMDMESGEYVDDAISIYETQARKGGVGIAMQAYLRRTEKDLKRLVKEKGVIRLVKGAYKADKEAAFQTRKETTDNYARLMRYLFKNSKKFTIATHDLVLISEAMELNRASRRDVTYAVLNGIRNGYAADMAAKGNRTAVYVPFGTRWIEFSIRRLNEWGHLMLIARSLLPG